VSGKDSTSSTTSTGSEGSTSGSDGSEIEGNMDITDDERSPSSHDRASGIISFKVVDHLCYVVIIANILSSSLSFYTPDVLPATEPTASKHWDAGYDYLSGARYRFVYGPADATATSCLLLQ